MKFSKIIALLAIITMGTSALGADGLLRRAVAQNDDNSNDVVILNTNTNSNANSATAAQTQSTVAQPTTIVEASPVSESRAEILRKERVNAEVQTEQKIVEKLEDSRLQEEKARAERLFGNKLDAQPAAVVVAPVAVPVVVPATNEVKATNVTIERVEIIQPREEKAEEPKIEKLEPIAPPIIVKTEVKAEEPVKKSAVYVSGIAGNLNYNASNVKSNYGLGVAIGTILDERFALELSYFYSNHYINTFWQAPLYNQLDQNDVSASAKYYILAGKLRPYAGASVTYINRTYNERVRSGTYWNINKNDSETTSAVNFGVLGGVEFQLSENFMIGGGLEYNINVMNSNEPDWVNNYSLPAGTTELEKINFYTLKVNAKFIF